VSDQRLGDVTPDFSSSYHADENISHAKVATDGSLRFSSLNPSSTLSDLLFGEFRGRVVFPALQRLGMENGPVGGTLGGSLGVTDSPVGQIAVDRSSGVLPDVSAHHVADANIGDSVLPSDIGEHCTVGNELTDLSRGNWVKLLCAAPLACLVDHIVSLRSEAKMIPSDAGWVIASVEDFHPVWEVKPSFSFVDEMSDHLRSSWTSETVESSITSAALVPEKIPTPSGRIDGVVGQRLFNSSCSMCHTKQSTSGKDRRQEVYH
jgi:hypothetical protein